MENINGISATESQIGCIMTLIAIGCSLSPKASGLTLALKKIFVKTARIRGNTMTEIKIDARLKGFLQKIEDILVVTPTTQQRNLLIDLWADTKQESYREITDKPLAPNKD